MRTLTPTASRASFRVSAKPARPRKSSSCSSARAHDAGFDHSWKSARRPNPAHGNSPVKGTFRSLRIFNYRVWASGAIVSNIGTWMQRTAQDWIVLTQLTRHNATAVGVVMALQFGPQLLLLPFTGFAADHMDRRKLVFATQATMGALALGLGLLTVFGLVRLWQVDV